MLRFAKRNRRVMSRKAAPSAQLAQASCRQQIDVHQQVVAPPTEVISRRRDLPSTDEVMLGSSTYVLARAALLSRMRMP